MIDPSTAGTLGLLSALFGGAVLGAAFFGGLWWTVRRCVLSDRPVLWFYGSLGIRTSLALTGIWLIGAGHWQRLAACLLGFMAARLLVTRLSRSAAVRFDGGEA